METREYAFKGTVMNGFLMLFVNLGLLVLSIIGIVYGIILLVVLCGDDSAQPVVNTGTLNH